MEAWIAAVYGSGSAASSRHTMAASFTSIRGRRTVTLSVCTDMPTDRGP